MKSKNIGQLTGRGPATSTILDLPAVKKLICSTSDDESRCLIVLGNWAASKLRGDVRSLLCAKATSLLRAGARWEEMEVTILSEFKIDGIVPIIPTPFDVDEEIDWAVLRGLLDFAAPAEVEAVCLPAYDSEFYKLTEAERRETVIVAAEHLGSSGVKSQSSLR